MKKITTLALSLALAASLTVPAFAAETVTAVPISAPIGYGYAITINGVTLDTAKVPAADANYIPMRLVTEADHGNASWYESENTGNFYLGDLRVTVNFADNAITVGETVLKELAVVKNGVTFLPATVFAGIEGYTTTVKDSSIDIVTPNNAPIVQLGYSISAATNLPGMRNSNKDLESFFGLKTENYTEIASFLPMMNVKSTSLFIAKVADGKMAAAKTELETYLKNLTANFEHYLVDQYELAKNGKIVTEGEYILFVISEDNDKAVEMFKAYVAEQK